MNERDLMAIRYRRDLWRLFTGMLPSELGPAVELGVAEGNFAEEILRWPVSFPIVYLVDRWESFPIRGDSANPQLWHDRNHRRVIDRTKPFGLRVRLLKMETVAAAKEVEDGTVSFVNIDADHSFEGVSADLNAWFPKMKRGGVIAFHDYENMNYGVKHAVISYCHPLNIKIYPLPEDKPEDAGAFIIC